MLLCVAFSIQAKGYTDLENFVRVIGSLDTNTSTVNYINGSVFLKQPGDDLKKIFNYEGYSINRKLPQDDGSILSLSREFVVYRDPISSEILQVWWNPITHLPNEVFPVANDPVNMVFDEPFLAEDWPVNDTVYIVYNSTVAVSYANPLDPDKYPAFSAGSVYFAVDLLSVFSNYSLLETTEDSLPMTGVWVRESAFLPWMQLGAANGSLYYNAFIWKCKDGLSCVANDIMQLVKKEYPEFQKAPTKVEKPNQTSWTTFKSILNHRREAGLPDFFIPTVNATANPNEMSYELEKRVEEVTYYSFPMFVDVTGTAWAEVPGKELIPLFDIKGSIGLDFQPLTRKSGYRFQIDGDVMLFNHTTKQLLVYFDNPFTGESKMVVQISGHYEIHAHYLIDGDSLYTTDIPSSQLIGLSGASSREKLPEEDWNTGNKWSVTMFNLLFPYPELEKPIDNTTYYGTYTQFRSWLDWMDMGDAPGNLLIKVSVGKEFIDDPYFPDE